MIAFDRSNPTKIFCIGLAKTGTSSFAKSMQKLGYRHLTGPHRSGICLATHNKFDPLLKLTQCYDSFDDYPWPLLYKTLHETYPSAYFVLTTRANTDRWFESVCKHYDRRGPSQDWYFLMGSHNPKDKEDEIKKFYTRHNGDVVAYFNQNPRFIEVCWEHGDGWPELTDLLGVKRVDEPFPKLNQTRSHNYRKTINRLVREDKVSHAYWYASRKACEPLAAQDYLFAKLSETVVAQYTPMRIGKRKRLRGVIRRFRGVMRRYLGRGN